jgi:hypothetical protein
MAHKDELKLTGRYFKPENQYNAVTFEARLNYFSVLCGYYPEMQEALARDVYPAWIRAKETCTFVFWIKDDPLPQWRESLTWLKSTKQPERLEWVVDAAHHVLRGLAQARAYT